MKKLIPVFFALFCTLTYGADEKFISCGPGYILVPAGKTDGINLFECQKLWCEDLETGKPMGSGDRANSGYKTTNTPMKLCDAENNCIQCFGDRKWCATEKAGVWNPGLGIYTQGGESRTYKSNRKGDCWAWSLDKPSCAKGQVAVMQNGEYVCASVSGKSGAMPSRASSVRRTGTIRRM